MLVEKYQLIDKYYNPNKSKPLLDRLLDSYGLNTCDECSTIKDSYNDLYWDCDYDLNGYSALCHKCYVKITGE